MHTFLYDMCLVYHCLFQSQLLCALWAVCCVIESLKLHVVSCAWFCMHTVHDAHMLRETLVPSTSSCRELLGNPRCSGSPEAEEFSSSVHTSSSFALDGAVLLGYLHRGECRKQMLAWVLPNLIRILIQYNSKYSCQNSVLWTILWICSRWKFTSLPSLPPWMGNQTVHWLGWLFPCLPLVFCWLFPYSFWLSL